MARLALAPQCHCLPMLCTSVLGAKHMVFPSSQLGYQVVTPYRYFSRRAMIAKVFEYKLQWHCRLQSHLWVKIAPLRSRLERQSCIILMQASESRSCVCKWLSCFLERLQTARFCACTSGHLLPVGIMHPGGCRQHELHHAHDIVRSETSGIWCRMQLPQVAHACARRADS